MCGACTEHAGQRPPAGNAVVSRHDGRPRPLDDSAVVLGVHKTSALDESQSQNLGNKKRSAGALCARARTLPRMWRCIDVRIFRPQPLLTLLLRTINFCRRPSCKVHTSTSHMIKPSEISRSNSRSLCSGIAVSSMSRSVRTSISLLELFHHLERMAMLQWTCRDLLNSWLSVKVSFPLSQRVSHRAASPAAHGRDQNHKR